MNLLSGAEIWCPLSVLERLNPYYRGFLKKKYMRILQRGSTVFGLFSKALVIIHSPAIFSVIVFILIRFRPLQQTT